MYWDLAFNFLVEKKLFQLIYEIINEETNIDQLSVISEYNFLYSSVIKENASFRYDFAILIQETKF